MNYLSRLSFISLLWCSSLIICSCGQNPSTDNAAEKTFNSKATFSVSGMTCGSCEKKLKARLEKMPGVASASVSRSNSPENVIVTFHSAKTNVNDIKSKIEEGGKFRVNSFTKNALTIK